MRMLNVCDKYKCTVWGTFDQPENHPVSLKKIASIYMYYLSWKRPKLELVETHFVRLYPKWALRRCMYILPEELNVFSHKSHWNGRSPVWILLCSWNLFFKLKPFPHVLQTKGFFFSSTWKVLTWIFMHACEISLPQKVHGVLLCTVLLCVFKETAQFVWKLHSSQWSSTLPFTHFWLPICFLRRASWVATKPHISQITFVWFFL